MRKLAFLITFLIISLSSFGQYRYGRGGVGRIVTQRRVVTHRRDVRPRPTYRPVGYGANVITRHYPYYYQGEVLISRNYVPYGGMVVVPSVSVQYETEYPVVVEKNVTNNYNYIVREDERDVIEDDMYVQQSPVYTAWTINFERNSYSIITNNDAHTNLMNVRDYVYRYPNSKITLYGYADVQTGNPVLNMNLSKNRCITVYNRLVNEYGISPTKIEIIANGSNSQRYSVNNFNRCVIIEMVKY